MDDNQIRIPPADGIKPASDELLQLYSCLENYQTCSYSPLKEIPPVFLNKYETAVQGSSITQQIPALVVEEPYIF